MSVRAPTSEAVPDAPRAAPRGFFSLELLDNRYPGLHGLRVLAIVSVVQYHVTWILWGEQGVPLDRRFVDGSLSVFFGMDLFFVLSGFLIGSILLRSLRQSGTQDLRRFYVRRIFRTFPSYYVVLTILALTLPLTALQRQHLVFEYTYLTNFLPLHRPQVIMFWGWSLALEEQFYLAVPILFFVLHRMKSERARIVLLVVLWAAALVVRLSIYFAFRPWNDFILYGAVYFRTYTRFDTLVMGILLAFVEQRYRSEIGAWLRHPLHRAILGVTALTCLWLLLRPGIFGPNHVQLVHIFTWGTVTSVMYFCLLLLLLHGDGWVHRALALPVFRRTATLGYGVYLVHIPLIDQVLVPVAHWAVERGVSLTLFWPVALAAVLAASFAIGYALHVLVEKPSLRLRERLSA
ncbi:MAG: acyltransferase [Myxococcales bacterium]|nr:acyltransferase [Myxococcales bacterium]